MGTTRSSANCNDRPVVGDWTGDGKADVGVYRTGRTVGQWRQQRGGTTGAFSWGRPGDMPIVGNFGGDRKDEVGIRRLGKTDFVLRSAQNKKVPLTAGRSTDVPLTGDWDGNGLSEIGLYRPSTRAVPPAQAERQRMDGRDLRRFRPAARERRLEQGRALRPRDVQRDQRDLVPARAERWVVHDQALRLRQGG